MKLNINRHMLTKNSWDSGSITSLSALMHRFAEPGSYQAAVLLGTDTAARFSLIVDEKAQEIPVKIDLGAIDQPVYTVNPRCYTVFQAPRGSGGYSIVVSKAKEGKKASIFDSRELQNGDMYIAAPLIPGHYAFTNQTGAGGHLEVVRPDKGKIHFIAVAGKQKMRQSAPEPVSVECTEKLFRPDKIRIQSGQSVAFNIKAPNSRIRIGLEKKEEGPVKTPPKRPPLRKKVPLKRL